MTRRRTQLATGDVPVDLRTHKRFARRQWRRRWLAWRRLLGVLLLAGLLGFGVWAVWFSTLLDVEEVAVRGTGILSEEEVRRVADVRVGEQLARVDVDTVRNRIASLAAVREVDVTRRWPEALEIVVVERTPVAVVEIGGRLRGLDADGVVFRDYPRAPAELPRVNTSIGTSAEALREAAAVVRALPDGLAPVVDHVEVATVDQISLALEGGRTVVWGSAADSDDKARVLQVLLRQKANVYDVSVPGQPTTSN